MIIGTFTYDPDRDSYRGDIRTLTLHLTSVELTPTARRAEREPDYRVTAEHGRGVVEYGAAWKRISESKIPFVSVSLDDPALPEAFYAALFLRDDGTTANLVWSRNLPKQRRAEPERPEATPQRRCSPAAREPRPAVS